MKYAPARCNTCGSANVTPPSDYADLAAAREQNKTLRDALTLAVEQIDILIDDGTLPAAAKDTPPYLAFRRALGETK